MDNFFTNAFNNLQNKEEFYKTVFMNCRSEDAEKLRVEYYAGKLKSMGKNVSIGAGVKIVNPEYVEIGDDVTICDDVTIIARGTGGIIIGNGVTITQRVYLDTERGDSGYIHIGDHVYIGTGTTLFGHNGLEIGEHTLLAQNISLTPYSHIFEDPSRPIIEQDGHCKKVTIGRDCYLGMNVTVLYSGDIGDGSVIGSAAVVVKPIPPYSVAVGNPARVIRKRGEKKE